MLEKGELEDLKLIFVTREECADTQSEVDRRIGSLHDDITIVKTKLNILIAILSAIGVAVLSVAVKLLFNT